MCERALRCASDSVSISYVPGPGMFRIRLNNKALLLLRAEAGGEQLLLLLLRAEAGGEWLLLLLLRADAGGEQTFNWGDGLREELHLLDCAATSDLRPPLLLRAL